MSIRDVTQSPVVLIHPADQEDRRYGVGTLFQVGPTTAALCCCLRVEGMPVGDFEDGSDAILFDNVSNIGGAKAIPISRNEKYIDKKTNQPRIVIKYPIVGGFVPFGAKRADGSPHPHAGTGFGISEALDFPMLEGGYYTKAHKQTEMVRKTDLTQYAYDGREFRVAGVRRFTAADPCRVPGSDWIILTPGLRQGVCDGDDLLVPIVATQGNPASYNALPLACGLARWRRMDGNWQPAQFVPIAITRQLEDKTKIGAAWAEPSLIRDINGDLLFTSRGCWGNLDNVIRIWRSTDGGKSWQVIVDVERARGQAPVTINQAADGTPYIVANVLGHERDWLGIWPLNAARNGLETQITVRNALEEFGPPPSGMVWFMDHPNGQTLRLADGRWHHLLTYRIMDRGEHGGGAPPPPTGQYVEEVFSDGDECACWRFA